MKFSIGPILLVTALLAGCGYKGDIVGKWKVDPAFIKKNASGPSDAFWNSYEHDQRYEFNADHTFTGPLSRGNYKISNGHVEMFTTEIRGAATGKSEAQTTAEVAGDGKSLTLHTTDDSMSPGAFRGGIPLVPDTDANVGPPQVHNGGGPAGGPSRAITVPSNSAPVGKKRG